MTELHTHILPGMDDGAPDLDTALALLELERQQGVERVALTSHFHPERMELTEFVNRRTEAMALLRAALAGDPSWPELKTGSEIYYSPRLAEMDLQSLCLEGTDLLLLELPNTMKPRFFLETLEELRNQGYVPLIAHAERYGYVLDNPGLLGDWMELGAYIQINAGSLLRGDARGDLCHRLIKWGLVHVVSSDTHSMERRPPNLDRGLAMVRRNLGDRAAARLERNARELFVGGQPELAEPHRPRRFLGRWV